jgi:hypothetical protein
VAPRRICQGTHGVHGRWQWGVEDEQQDSDEHQDRL